jgi:glucokinase
VDTEPIDDVAETNEADDAPTGIHSDDNHVAVLALDIGATLVKGGVIRADRSVWHTVRTPTFEEDDNEPLIEKVKSLLWELRAGARDECAAEAVAIGIAAPGLVDEDEGVICSAYNLGWQGVCIVRELEAEFGLPVTLRQDARAAALIEQRIGAAHDVEDFLFVALGTGIGSALVLAGDPRTGVHNRAGEIGHIVVDRSGEVCACGERGCLETIASARAIARRYNARRRADEKGVDAEGVLDRMRAGDKLAAEVFAEAVDALTVVLTAVQKTVDVELVVLGGGLAMAGAGLLDPLDRAMNRPSPVVHPARLACSAVGQLAGLLGAGTAALEYVASSRG